MNPAKSRALRWAIPVVLLAAFLLASPLWLRGLGGYLVHADGPAHAEIAVVLAGGYSGERILKAAELVREGFVPRVLVSGPEGFYGVPESDLAISFAEKKGYPGDWFIPFPNEGKSTVGEAEAILAELHRRNIHRFLVVTSNYHTRRAGRIYRSLDPADDVRVVAAPDRDFRPDDWWRSREGLKTFVLEWEKTVANCFGI